MAWASCILFQYQLAHETLPPRSATGLITTGNGYLDRFWTRVEDYDQVFGADVLQVDQLKLKEGRWQNDDA